MTRVLMTADAVGGVWTYALELVGALRGRGVEVALATMGPPPDAGQIADARAAGVAELRVGRFALEWMDDPWADVDRAGDWLLEVADEVAPDVVHLGGYVHASLPWDRPTVVVAHSCVVSWWRAVHGCDPPPAWDEYRRRVRKGLAAADAVVAPSAAMLEALRAAHGFDRGTVIPNCRRTSAVPHAPLGLKERLVVATGRVWDEAKGIASVVEVAPRLDAEVLVAGAAGAAAGGAAGATLLGRLPFEEVAALLARAAVYAAPARYEPFGLGALEAGLAGCALVLGDIPSQREVWADAAAFVPPGDTEALAATLQHLLADDHRRTTLARRARKQACAYEPARTAAAYRSLYAQLTSAVGSLR